MVESNSSCLETYKITFQSRLYLVWLRRYDKKLIWAAILDFFLMLKGENSKKKRCYVKKCPLAAGL